MVRFGVLGCTGGDDGQGPLRATRQGRRNLRAGRRQALRRSGRRSPAASSAGVPARGRRTRWTAGASHPVIPVAGAPSGSPGARAGGHSRRGRRRGRRRAGPRDGGGFLSVFARSSRRRGSFLPAGRGRRPEEIRRAPRPPASYWRWVARSRPPLRGTPRGSQLRRGLGRAGHGEDPERSTSSACPDLLQPGRRPDGLARGRPLRRRRARFRFPCRRRSPGRGGGRREEGEREVGGRRGEKQTVPGSRGRISASAVCLLPPSPGRERGQG